MFIMRDIFSGLSCWEIENFLPNQVEEGMYKESLTQTFNNKSHSYGILEMNLSTYIINTCLCH